MSNLRNVVQCTGTNRVRQSHCRHGSRIGTSKLFKRPTLGLAQFERVGPAYHGSAAHGPKIAVGSNHEAILDHTCCEWQNLEPIALVAFTAGTVPSTTCVAN